MSRQECSGSDRNEPSRAAHDHVTDKEQLKIPHTFMVHTYALPTICQFCKKLLKGLFKQGVQCKDCQYNAHKKCIDQIPQSCCGDHETEYNNKSNSHIISEEMVMGRNDHFDNNASKSHKTDVEELNDVTSDNEYKFGGNIPLMRIVQSVKQTKRRTGQIIKEGWLVHFTNRDPSIRRHYWRIDSKMIALHNSENGSNYFKEIPLADIMTIDSSSTCGSYCFRIQTRNVDYFVGQHNTSDTSNEVQIMTSPNSGLGAHLAKSWETTIRQAMMPILNSSK